MNPPVVHQVPPNPCAALENRQTFDALGITCVSVVGNVGAGKTCLIEALLPRLRRNLRLGFLKGDLVASIDAQRMAAQRIPAVQVLTDARPHLTAAQVQAGVGELPLGELDLLFVEDLGGPLPPPAGQLGEHLRVSVLSVADGAGVAGKYPGLVHDAGLVLLAKCGLLAALDFDRQQVVRDIRRINAAAEIVLTDTYERIGIDRAAGWLLGYVRAQATQASGVSHTPALTVMPAIR